MKPGVGQAGGEIDKLVANKNENYKSGTNVQEIDKS